MEYVWVKHKGLGLVQEFLEFIQFELSLRQVHKSVLGECMRLKLKLDGNIIRAKCLG